MTLVRIFEYTWFQYYKFRYGVGIVNMIATYIMYTLYMYWRSDYSIRTPNTLKDSYM